MFWQWHRRKIKCHSDVPDDGLKWDWRRRWWRWFEFASLTDISNSFRNYFYWNMKICKHFCECIIYTRSLKGWRRLWPTSQPNNNKKTIKSILPGLWNVLYIFLCCKISKQNQYLFIFIERRQQLLHEIRCIPCIFFSCFNSLHRFFLLFCLALRFVQKN